MNNSENHKNSYTVSKNSKFWKFKVVCSESGKPLQIQTQESRPFSQFNTGRTGCQ